MKKMSFSLVTALLFSGILLEAQEIAFDQKPLYKKWKISQYDFGLGVNTDHYESMSLDELMIFAKNPEELSRNLSHLQEENTTMTAGVAIFGNVSFSPLGERLGSYRSDRELRIGIGIHSPKEAMVSYKNEALDTSIVYCNSHGEFTLEGAYLHKGQWGKKIHWYWGYGMNAGLTFSNEIIIISGKYFGPGEHPSLQESLENNIERYEAKPVIYSRVYIPYGIHYSLNEKWLIGLDFKTGVGLQKIQGETANFIRKTGSFIIGAKYRL